MEAKEVKCGAIKVELVFKDLAELKIYRTMLSMAKLSNEFPEMHARWNTARSELYNALLRVELSNEP